MFFYPGQPARASSLKALGAQIPGDLPDFGQNVSLTFPSGHTTLSVQGPVIASIDR